jgi:pyruvate/2-oxoglutarate dehydrogenase complex dihydrolipoamide dehydrogenase (E3) component
MTVARHDAVVVGTGQAAKPLAVALADAGWSVAVVERAEVGGSCINYGCTPTKTMVASARIAHLARHAAAWGVETGPVGVDFGRVIDRKERIVRGFRRSVEHKLEETRGVTLVRGHARFVAPRELEVALTAGGTAGLTAEHVFLDTGTRSRVPPIDGLDRVPFLDNASVLELRELPRHLLVLGGGYIGVELGQAFRRFGAEVTIVHHGPRLLSREDEDVSAALREILVEEGIEVLLGAETREVAGAGGDLRLRVAASGGERELAGSHLLVAVGRVPNSDDLGLEAAGVEVDEGGYVRVDERLATTAPGVWALGDVNGGPAFTHVAYDDFRIVRANLLGAGGATTRGRLVPSTVFTDPQLGRVGMSESEARQSGRNVRVAKLPMTRVARALEVGEVRGFMKAVVDADSEEILGCAIFGLEGGEVMAVLQMAMLGGLRYPAIREAIFAHPTLAESLNNLFLTLDAPPPRA